MSRESKLSDGLRMAVLNKDIHFVNDFLLSNGSESANWLDSDGEAPLNWLANKGHDIHWVYRQKMVRLLLQHGANVNIKTPLGSTPLIDASAEGFAEMVELLLQADADVNTSNNAALHNAVLYGHAEIVDLLLHYDANANAVDDEGNTPLHQLLELNNYCEPKDIIRSLMYNGGANLDAKNKRGNTLLHDALMYCNDSDSELLLESLVYFGASEYIENNKGEAPLQLMMKRTNAQALINISLGTTIERRRQGLEEKIKFILLINPNIDRPSSLNEDYQYRKHWETLQKEVKVMQTKKIKKTAYSVYDICKAIDLEKLADFTASYEEIINEIQTVRLEGILPHYASQIQYKLSIVNTLKEIKKKKIADTRYSAWDIFNIKDKNKLAVILSNQVIETNLKQLLESSLFANELPEIFKNLLKQGLRDNLKIGIEQRDALVGALNYLNNETKCKHELPELNDYIKLTILGYLPLRQLQQIAQENERENLQPCWRDKIDNVVSCNTGMGRRGLFVSNDKAEVKEEGAKANNPTEKNLEGSFQFRL